MINILFIEIDFSNCPNGLGGAGWARDASATTDMFLWIKLTHSPNLPGKSCAKW